MGYRELESYERNNDMFWGLTPGGFKKLMDELGMKLVSSHCEIEKDFQRKVEQAASIGMKYLVFNWPHSPQPMDAYRRMADLFNRCGEACRDAGIRFAYHNYASSYEQLEGIFPQDLLMDRTDAGLVYHQMDVYWVYRAGQDPVKWLEKYPGRYLMTHLKDGTRKETTRLGIGNLQLADILKAGVASGVLHWIVEQEDYGGESYMEAAAKNAEWMRSH